MRTVWGGGPLIASINPGLGWYCARGHFVYPLYSGPLAGEGDESYSDTLLVEGAVEGAEFAG